MPSSPLPNIFWPSRCANFQLCANPRRADLTEDSEVTSPGSGGLEEMGCARVGEVGLIFWPRAVHQATVAASVGEYFIVVSRHVYGAIRRECWGRLGVASHVR